MKLGNNFEKDTYFDNAELVKAFEMETSLKIKHINAFAFSNGEKYIGMVHLDDGSETGIYTYIPEKVSKFIVDNDYLDLINNSNATYRVWKETVSTGRLTWKFDIDVEE